MQRTEWLAGWVMSMVASSMFAAPVQIQPDETLFAVITHKGGFASGVAHNHLVAASEPVVKLVFDPASPLAASFELKTKVEKLGVDPWDLAQKWYPRFEELGVLSESFSEVGEKDRQKIRGSMIAKGQLNSAKFPDISAQVVSVEEEASTHGTVQFPYAVKLALEIRGQRVEKIVAARFEQAAEGLQVEAVGTFLFTDFGIKPYSALLGAVKNEDEFHIYVNLKGVAPHNSDDVEQAAAPDSSP